MSGRKKATKAGQMTMRRKQLIQDSSSKMEHQVIDWMDVNVPEPSGTIVATTSGNELDAFIGTLSTGVRLCRLIKKIDPSISIPYNADAKAETFPGLENITLFVKAAKDLGVPSTVLFQASDVPARSNDQGVLTTLSYLSRIALKRQQIVPPPAVQAQLDAEAAAAEADGKRTSHFDEKYKDGNIAIEHGDASLETNDDHNDIDTNGVAIVNGHAKGKVSLVASVQASSANSNGSKANGTRVNGAVNGTRARVVTTNGSNGSNGNGHYDTSSASPPLSPLAGSKQGRVSPAGSNGTPSTSSSPSSTKGSPTRRSSRDEGQPESLSHHLRQLRATMTWRKLVTIIIAFPFWAVIELQPIVLAFIASLPVYYQQMRTEIVRRIAVIIDGIHERRQRLRRRIIAAITSVQNNIRARITQLVAIIDSWAKWAVNLFVTYVWQPIQRVYVAIVSRINAVRAWIHATITKIRTFITNTIETYVRAPIRRLGNAVIAQYKRVRASIISLVNRLIIEPYQRVRQQVVAIISRIYNAIITRYIAVRDAIRARVIAVRDIVRDIITRTIATTRTQVKRAIDWAYNTIITIISEVRYRLVVPTITAVRNVINLAIKQVNAAITYVWQLHVRAATWSADKVWLAFQLWAELIFAPSYQLTERIVIWSWDKVVLPVSERAAVVLAKIWTYVTRVSQYVWSYIDVAVTRARVIIAAVTSRIQRIVAYVRAERDRIVAAIRGQAKWAFDVLRSIAVQLNKAVVQPIIGGVRVIVDAVRAEVKRLSALVRQLVDTARQYIQHIVDAFNVAISPLTKSINKVVIDARVIIIQIWAAITALFVAARRDIIALIASARASLVAIRSRTAPPPARSTPAAPSPAATVVAAQ